MAKTWIGLSIVGHNICTVKEFSERFNISETHFRECRNILIKEKYIRQQKVLDVVTGEDNNLYFFSKGNKYDLCALSPLANIKTGSQLERLFSN